jgi:hypothetical protein
LNGYGDNLTPKDKRVNLISGFSENIVRMMLATEQGIKIEEEKESGEVVEVKREIPTIEQIRANW